jgi:NAD(P)-dependent dehydrogenase (short-subunit alcohol dehydrogenase family)
MKIIIIGASGTIGKAVIRTLKARHEIIRVGYSQGDYQLDISNEESITDFFKSIGTFDALIATTGKVHFGALKDMNTEDFQLGLNNKLMGQVNLVRHGLKYINKSGSFTLTSGILNQDPIPNGSSASMVNGALEGFVIGAAIEMSNNVRINIVSPTLIYESLEKYKDYFKGFIPVSVATATQAYIKSVEGKQTGQIYKVGW